MGVDSVFEMYTFLWGWHQYNAIWNILLDTGLAFIPFLGILFNAFIQTFTSQDPGEASAASLRSIEYDFIAALLVIILAAQPLVTVELKEMEFVSVCAGTTLVDQVRNIAETPPEDAVGLDRLDMRPFVTAKLPVWWFGVLSISHGIVHAAKKGLPCVDDIRILRFTSHVHDLKDTKLLQLLIDFGHGCYLPALSKFSQDERDPSRLESGAITQDLEKRASLIKGINLIFGQSDTGWIGSQTLFHVPGYYDVLSMTRTDPETKKEVLVNCKGMWNQLVAAVTKEFKSVTVAVDPKNPSNRVPIMEHLFKVVKQKSEFIPAPLPGQPIRPSILFLPKDLEAVLKSFDNDPQNYIREQAVIRALIDENIAFDPVTFSDDPTWGFYHSYDRFATKWGQKLVQFSHYGEVDAFTKSIPFVGGLILMASYIFLPLGLVASSYSLKFLIVASVGLFGAKFFFYLWHLVWWLDQNYLLMVSRNDGALTDFFNNNQQTYEITIGFVITSLYFALPLLWTMIVAWAGFGIADSFSGSFTSSSPAQAMGQSISHFMNRAIYRGAQFVTSKGISVTKGAKQYLILHKDLIKQSQTDFKTLDRYVESAERKLAGEYQNLEKIEEVNDNLRKKIDEAKNKYGPLDGS